MKMGNVLLVATVLRTVVVPMASQGSTARHVSVKQCCNLVARIRYIHIKITGLIISADIFKPQCESELNLLHQITSEQFAGSIPSSFTVDVSALGLATVTSSAVGAGHWLEVDLQGRMRVVSSTTGSHSNTWIDAYHISHTDVRVTWTIVRDVSGLPEVFLGNREELFSSDVIARFVRIHPISYLHQLNFQWWLQGCPFGESLAHLLAKYSILRKYIPCAFACTCDRMPFIPFLCH